MTLDRRRFLALGSSATVAAALVGIPDTADAHEAVRSRSRGTTVEKHAPGFYRVDVGAFAVTAISDGTFALDADALLLDIGRHRLTSTLAKSFLTSPVETSNTTFLIETGSKLVLVDTGAGTTVGARTGRFAANLRAAGYDPADIDLVLFTHLHNDHVGGMTTPAGTPAFPNADVHLLLERTELDYWLSKKQEANAPKDKREFFEIARRELAPYRDRFHVFDSDREIVAGVHSVLSPGHTPGHTGYMVTSGADRLLIWGDIVHLAEVQFAYPDVSIEFDSYPHRAADQRRATFQNASQGRYRVAGAHLPFPGIGHVREAGEAFQFVPSNYTLQ